LFSSRLRGGADGKEALFATLDAGEDVRERFGADIADGGHVGIGGEHKRVREIHVCCLGVDSIDDRLYRIFWGLLTEESQDLFALLAERNTCCSVRGRF
jgi:hypothetical protein